VSLLPEALDHRAAEIAELVRSSQDGDHDAFASLVKLHQHRVFRLAGRFFPRAQDVEEIAQETFLLAWRKLHTYRAKAPFEHWLTRICLNCCYGALRTMKRWPEQLDAGWDGQVPERDPTADMGVRSALARLAPVDRFVLVLLEAEGLSVDEVAKRLGWSGVNVRVRAHRARKRLRRLLEEGLK
jgi:RNA polymerase sigma-70 factor (ECF subfamily)